MSETEATAPLEVAPRRRMAVSTALFAIATGLSRVAGVLREIVAAAFFGVQGSISAFTVAFQVPNLVRALVADAALGAAFVPVFNDLLVRGDRERAWRVASSVFWLSFVGLSAITLVFEFLAPEVMGIFGYHDALAIGLARVMFPTLILFGLAGVVNAMLNAFDEFFVPALAPVAWNVVIVAVLVGAAPFWHSIDDRLYAYAIGILVGTAVQFALPLPLLRGRGGRLSLSLDTSDPLVRRVFVLMLPVSLGLGLINVNLLIDTWFATRVNANLAPAAIDKAFRIYMLPQGMFSVAVATVAFPALSRAASARNGQAYRRTLATALRQIAFLLVPASVSIAVLSQPMVRLVFQHGHFDASQTHVVAQALAAFSLGLTFNGIMLMLNRAFFSLQMPWGPTRIAVATLIANIALDALFYRPFGVWGIPFATSFVNIVGTILLSRSLKPVIGPFITPRFRRAMLVIAVASAVLAGVSFGVWYGLDALLGRTLPAQFVSLLLGLGLGGLAYLWTAKRLGLDELRALHQMRRSRTA
jgi:putative peptidoglycan lipid II flippase